MNRKSVLCVCFVALALCAIPAMADTLYSNLGTGTSVYNCCTGWTVSGYGYVGTSFIAANEFQVAQSGSVSQIDVAVGLVNGPDSFYVAIYADSGGAPGSQLAMFSNLNSNGNNFGNCCNLTTITGISGLNLTAGTNYWMVIGPMDTTSTTWEAWNFSNSATGNDSYSTDGGREWISNGNQPQGAFDIIGGPGSTPEPSSLLLFGTGVVGAFAAFRRKLNL